MPLGPAVWWSVYWGHGGHFQYSHHGGCTGSGHRRSWYTDHHTISTLGAFGAVGVSIIHCAAAGDTHCT